jgi:hypothetical protein
MSPKILLSGLPEMVMGNVTVHDFTTLAMVLIILFVRGHAEVAAIRFSPTSPPALANPGESEALRLLKDFS